MLRSGGTKSKNKTQTISVSTLVKNIIITFLVFNDLPSYFDHCSLLTNLNCSSAFTN